MTNEINLTLESAEVLAVVTRADGTVEDLGRVSFWDRSMCFPSPLVDPALEADELTDTSPPPPVLPVPGQDFNPDTHEIDWNHPERGLVPKVNPGNPASPSPQPALNPDQPAESGSTPIEQPLPVPPPQTGNPSPTEPNMDPDALK